MNASGENAIVIVSGANELLSEDDVTKAEPLISSAAVMVCQLEIDPEITHLALSLAKSAGSKIYLLYQCFRYRYSPGQYKRELHDSLGQDRSSSCKMRGGGGGVTIIVLGQYFHI